MRRQQGDLELGQLGGSGKKDSYERALEGNLVWCGECKIQYWDDAFIELYN